jgi:AbrB family looped-hinge helix DNA binding protein
MCRESEHGAVKPQPNCPRQNGTRRHIDVACVRRYLTNMRTTVSSKGQIVLPAELRQMDRIEPGQEFEVERLDRGEYRLVRRAAPPNDGAVDWLLACPEKGFFVPVESESTDTL